MTATTREEDRTVGLVWQAAGGGPAAHVLIVGVSRYDPERGMDVSSPARSARALVDYFVGEGGSGFRNAETPLGSVAVLLSEAEDGAQSTVLGGPVPRASFEEVEKAIAAWRRRAEAGDRAADNLLLLFVISHGQSSGRRSAILLEDFGTNPNNDNAGMTNIEQLVSAITALKPNAKFLVFDCCRLETADKRGDEDSLGTPLLAIAPRPGAWEPTVLRATALRGVAYGRDDGLTVLMEALLEAARGLAATPATDWVVTSSSLATTTIELVGLRRRDGEVSQRAGSALSVSFPISAVAETKTTAVFITLRTDDDITSVRFTEKAKGKVVRTLWGVPDGFVRVDLADEDRRLIEAHDAADKLIGSVEFKPAPPLLFRQMPGRIRLNTTGAERSAHGLAADAMAKIEISVEQSRINEAAYGPVVTLTADRSAAAPIIRLLPTNGHKETIPVPAGGYSLVIASASGVGERRRFTAEPGAVTRISFAAPDAGSKVLERAMDAGVWQEAAPRATRPPSGAAAALLDSARVWLVRRAATDTVVEQHISGATIIAALCGFDGPLAEGGIETRCRLSAGPSEAGHGLLVVEDTRRRPFRRGLASAADQPFWLAVAGHGWRELAWCPTLGLAGALLKDVGGAADPWSVEFLLDARPDADRSHVAAVVKSRRWTPLLAFLARRDFVHGGAVVAAMIKDGSLGAAVGRGLDNPLAAIAGALMAIAAGQDDEASFPIAWLEILADKFSTLPDGPVLLARALRRRGAADAERGRALALKAALRGVPAFSLSLDWLSEELSFYRAHPECAELARRFQKLALMADPGRAFTVLSVG